MSNEVGGSDPDDPPTSPELASPAYAQPHPYGPPGRTPADYPAEGYQQPGFQPQGYPAPGHQPQGYPPPDYQGYPPGYPPPGYGQPQYPPPGYGYPPPGYPGAIAPPLKPGIIPLRPLTLSEIFNGAIAYVRMNPKATMGITALVVVAAQILGLVIQIWSLSALGALEPTTSDPFGEGATGPSVDALIGSSLSDFAGLAANGLALIVLNGLLTVIVGRAVFGSKITIGEAWQRARGRLLPLIGLTAVQGIASVLLVVVAVVLTVLAYYAAGGGAAFGVGALLTIAVLVVLVYVNTILVFAPALIVLERLSIGPAIARSFALVRNDFWRVFGIWLLASIVANVIALAVAVPFGFIGGVLSATSATGAVIGLVLAGVGAAIGQVITAPFSAGVVVLLYTDRRIRAEAFDLVLQTGASAPVDAPADSTDHLWLTARR